MGRTKRRQVTKWDDVSFNPRYSKPRYKRRAKPADIPLIDPAVYFTSPHWIGLRDRIRDERKCCEACTATQRLSLHHRRYTRRNESVFWKERDEDLVLLCWPCHVAWERHCKRMECSPEQLARIQTLLRAGLARDDAFPAGVAANAQELVSAYTGYG